MSTTTPPPSPTPAPPPTSKETIEVWAGYAKDRFDAVTKRVDEFRNWARQLAGAIAILIGFELTLLGRLLDMKPPYVPPLRVLTIGFLFGVIVLQVALLLWAFFIGYRGRRFIGPESPTVLAGFIATADEKQTTQFIGAYYARAFDVFFGASEEIAKDIDHLTKWFSGTIGLLVVSLALLLALSFSTPGRAYTGRAMSTPAMSPSPAPPPSPAPSPQPAPAPAAPQAGPSAPAMTPILVTPTVGLPQTFSAQRPGKK